MELGLFWPPCASPDPHPSLFLVSHVHTRELAWRLSVTSLLPPSPPPGLHTHSFLGWDYYSTLWKIFCSSLISLPEILLYERPSLGPQMNIAFPTYLTFSFWKSHHVYNVFLTAHMSHQIAIHVRSVATVHALFLPSCTKYALGHVRAIWSKADWLPIPPVQQLSPAALFVPYHWMHTYLSFSQRWWDTLPLRIHWYLS